MTTLRLIDAGTNKLQIVKLIRIYSQLGLKESKDIVDHVPSEFYIDEEITNINLMILDFERSGAKVLNIDNQKDNNDITLNTKKRYLKLVSGSSDKIRLMELVREYSLLDLKECKNLVEDFPAIFELRSDESFYDIKYRFTEIGASIEETAEYEFFEIKNQRKSIKDKNLSIEILLMGRHQIEVIKLVQLYSGLGLSESKKIVDGIPSIFKVKNQKFTYEQIKKNFEAIGAIVSEVAQIEKQEKYSPNEIDSSYSHTKPLQAGTKNLYNHQESTFLNEKKTKSYETDISNLVGENFKIINQKQDIRNAVIFANVSAIVLSVFPLSYFGIIFIISYIISYLLRKKNLPDKMLGKKSALLVLNYFIARTFLLTLILPIISGQLNGSNLKLFVYSVFNSSNITVLIAAGIAFFLASDKRVFKNSFKDDGLINR